MLIEELTCATEQLARRKTAIEKSHDRKTF